MDEEIEMEFRKEWAMILKSHSDIEHINVGSLLPIEDKSRAVDDLIASFTNKETDFREKLPKLLPKRDSVFDDEFWVRSQRRRKYLHNKLF